VTSIRLVCVVLPLLAIGCSNAPVNPAATSAEQEEVDEDDEDLSREPRTAEDYVERGDAYVKKKEYGRALADYEQGIRLGPEDADAHYSLAWLLATCPKDDVRDGKRALALATRACELSQWQDADHLGALAAAHAECGNFAEAVKWQKKAIKVGFDNDEAREAGRKQLRLYEQGKPYRDD
jgi:tetratricopeptide (TPR) repeat protein